MYIFSFLHFLPPSIRGREGEGTSGGGGGVACLAIVYTLFFTFYLSVYSGARRRLRDCHVMPCVLGTGPARDKKERGTQNTVHYYFWRWWRGLLSRFGGRRRPGGGCRHEDDINGAREGARAGKLWGQQHGVVVCLFLFFFLPCLSLVVHGLMPTCSVVGGRALGWELERDSRSYLYTAMSDIKPSPSTLDAAEE